MEVKLLRLFGFEVNPYIKGEKRLRGFEEGNQSGKPFEEENENEKYLNIASSVMENTAKEKSSGHELEHKKYRCQFCQREFRNPQAMGGHQNAHKKEKVKKRRMQLQEKSNLSNSYCSPLQSQNNTVYHNSSPWPSSSDVAKFTCYEECLISFNHSCTNQIPDYGVPNVSKSISLAPQNCTPETSSRSVVIKPSPSHLSNNCQSLYIQLGLPQK